MKRAACPFQFEFPGPLPGMGQCYAYRRHSLLCCGERVGDLLRSVHWVEDGDRGPAEDGEAQRAGVRLGDCFAVSSKLECAEGSSPIRRTLQFFCNVVEDKIEELVVSLQDSGHYCGILACVWPRRR